MAVQVSYPGVYIEEFTPGAPIQGVGTATAAFLGPAASGPLNTPTKITSWESFMATFGAEPLDGFYLWYAVRGFFENNGQVCYIDRVSTGDFDKLVLNDRNSGGARPTIKVSARVAGDNTGNQINVAIANANAVSTTLFRPTAAVAQAAGEVIEVTAAALADAAKFLPGNRIVIAGGGKTNSVTVQRVDGALIRVTPTLGATTYAAADAATVRLASLSANADDSFRVDNGAKLAAGSVVTLSQAAGANPAVTDTAVVKSVTAERIAPGLTTYRVELKKPLAQAFDLSAAAAIDVTSQEFTLTVTQGTYAKPYPDLSMDPGHPRYFASIVNGDPLGRVNAAAVEPNSTPAPFNRPAVAAAAPLTGGAPDQPPSLQAHHYKEALGRLEAIDDVNMIAIPDRTDDDVQLAMIAHCERMHDRFAILDSRPGAKLSGSGSVVEHRHGVDSTDGYAALYYPWLFVSPATGPGRVLVPPSGHVAGVFARTDARRGVFKAPAGEEALLNGVLGVEQNMSDIDQGQLNLNEGINVIRVFKGGGRAVVWGARTTATNRSWQYVNVRRLFLFLEESIEEGIRWAVFEPNIPPLWKKLNRTITAFLTQQFRDGALFGNKPEEAFYVRIDEVLNPDAERALGRLHIEIGIRPAYPAEFIIVRIGIWAGGSEISES